MTSSTAQHRTASLQVEPDIQMFALWQTLRNSWKPLLMASLVVGAATYGAMSLIAPRFTSESQLEFVSRRNNPFPEAGDRAAAPDNAARLDQAAMNTHARALMSSDLLLKVAGDLKLRNRVEFNSALGSLDTWSSILRLFGIGTPPPGTSEIERVLSVVKRQLEVAAIKETRSIAIRFTSADNAMAAEFANAMADTYRAGLVSAPVEETSKVVQALIPKVDQLRKEVLDAEGAVERYRASSDQFRSGPQSAPVTDQRMAGLQDELLKSEAARNEAEARWRTARELMQSGSAEVLPDVQKSALIQALIQQRVRLERQIAEASASLLSGHPRMQQLNADVAGLRRQIAAEVEKVVQSIQKDARSATIRVDTVSKQITALKSKVSGDTGNEARLKELESLARAKRTELDRLQKQLEDNRTVVNIRQVPIEAQIISRAIASSTPVFPRKGPAALLASAATLILGLALMITKALVSAAPASAYPAGSSMPRPAQPVEPSFAPTSSPRPGAPSPLPVPRTLQVSAAGSRTGTAQTIAGLTRRLASRTDTAAGVRTLVTTESAGLDPIAEALVLCEQLSEVGKRVVLIVWDLAGNAVEIARTSLRKPGITDLLGGRASFEQVIGRIPGSKVHLIQPGAAPTDPASVLDADHLNLTLDALDEAYDQIVVVAACDDARRLFETVEGRFDAAVVVTPGTGPRREANETGMLLGFEVTGIDVVHIPQTLQKPLHGGPPAGRTTPTAGLSPSQGNHSPPG